MRMLKNYRCKGPRINTGRFGSSRSLLLSRLCPSILKPDLNSGLGQPEIVGELFAHEGIWIVRLLKQAFQSVNLLRREVCTRPSLTHLFACWRPQSTTTATAAGNARN